MPEENTMIQAPTGAEMVEFGTFRNPEDVLKTAEVVAKAFKLRANRLQLFKRIGPSDHLLIEGWQTLAAMYRVTAGIAKDEYVEFGDARGFEATAEALYVPTGARISTAKAMCLNDEDNWGFRPKYEYIDKVKTKTGDVAVPLQQLRSMAQTRACSKVLSNLLKWVARMAGYAGTPAEEMTEHGNGEEAARGSVGSGNGNTAPQRAGKAAPTDPISEAQLKRLFALAGNAGKSREEIGIIAAHFGFTDLAAITRERYEAICAEVMK